MISSRSSVRQLPPSPTLPRKGGGGRVDSLLQSSPSPWTGGAGEGVALGASQLRQGHADGAQLGARAAQPRWAFGKRCYSLA